VGKSVYKHYTAADMKVSKVGYRADIKVIAQQALTNTGVSS